MNQSTPGPRDVLEQFRQAAIDQSVEAMSRLYAADAVHEFPFTRPGVPSRMEGREEIVAFMATNWSSSPLKYEEYRTLAVHDTGDPDTIVVEQEAIGRNGSGDSFTLPNIVVLTIHDGRITGFRDYVNVLAVAQAVGRS